MSISLADRNGCEGYQVRVTRNGKCYSKFFRKTRGAKKAATEYEAKLLKKLGPRKSQVGSVRSRRKVNRGLWESDIKGNPYVCASSRYPNGTPKTIMVSVRKHGKVKAYEIARKKKRQADRLAYTECDA
jgi:hypothetical protein